MAPNIPPNTGQVPTIISVMPRVFRVPNANTSAIPTIGQLWPRKG